MDVQTRNNDGEIKHFPTIAYAFSAAERDRSIWKISWNNESTNERVRLVRHTGLMPSGPGKLTKGPTVWVYEPIVIPRLDQTLPDDLTVEDFFTEPNE